MLPAQGWDFLRPVYLPAAEILGLPGVCALGYGIYLMRDARALRNFNEDLLWSERPLRGTVSDQAGSPIARATVDVFVDGMEESRPVATLVTDIRGRFSADLADGNYLLQVGVPELGESSMQVAVAKSGENQAMQIRIDGSSAAE